MITTAILLIIIMVINRTGNRKGGELKGYLAHPYTTE